ncbi:MAG: hypothetical protein WEE89_02040 [Gemmatimonadota bacterium]
MNQDSPDHGKHGSPPLADLGAPTGTEPSRSPDLTPGELDVLCERNFTVDGVEWVAYVSGRGAYGTGHFGLASLQTIHFALAGEPGTPLLETLVPANQFAGLFDRQLMHLLKHATRIVIPEGGAAAAPRRFSLSDDT